MRRSVVDTLGVEMNVNTHALKGLFLGVLLLVGACGGGSKPPPGSPCLKNTDCTNPLSCSYGLCHVTCAEARDCPTGQDCVKAPTGNVCQLPIETKCEYLSQCMSPLVCALDRQCRSQCLKDIDCATSTQKCVGSAPDMVCAEPGEINQATGLLKNSLGTPVPDAPPDAGAGDAGVNTVIGTAGGTVSGAGAEVVVPAGALAQDQNLSIQVTTSGYPPLPAGAVLLSNVLAIQPHGQTFSKPVTVSVGFTARPGATPELITAAPGGSWASVAGATISGASMQAMVSHFSFFAVIGLTADGGAGDVPVGNPGDAGAGGGGGSSCPSPQTSFGLIGQGDSNPNFQTGVGALGPNVMYIFSGFFAPAGDGGPGSQEVYVQAFDPKTGASKGPSQPLFSPPLLGLGGTTYVGSDVNLYNAAVAPTGDIALVYGLYFYGPALYVAFLSPSTANDGGVDGLQLQHVQLLADGVAGVAEGGQRSPRVVWSNASQTFVVSYTSHNPEIISVNKFSVGGQTASGIGAVPVPTATTPSYSQASVGESGNLLGVQYPCTASPGDGIGRTCLTILDENENLVGNPFVLASAGAKSIQWTSVAGTAQGFACFFMGNNPVVFEEVFVSTSPDAGIVGADASADGGLGTTTLPPFNLSEHVDDIRAISDNVGTGGRGGVGLALLLDDNSVSFAYVNADGVGHQGPSQVLQGAQNVNGPGPMSMTNFNGSFVLSAYNNATKSTQVVATGICP